MPRLAVPSADFVREGEAIPVAEAGPTAAATISPCKIKIKIKVIVMAIWELLRNQSAEDLLKQI